jgi:HK97 family phage portal protein
MPSPNPERLSLRARLGNAYKAFRYPSYYGPSITTTGAGWLAGLAALGLSPGSRYDWRREAGSLWTNGVVLTCLNWVCRNWPEARQVVNRPGANDKLEPVPNHPARALLKRPNRDYGAAALWAGTILSWFVDGNAYWYKERNSFGQVVGLTYVPHFMLWPYGSQDGSRLTAGYAYQVDGKLYTYAPEEIIHFQNGVDPTNMRRGLGDLAAELRSICNDNESQNFSATLLRNMGIPGAVLSPKEKINLTPEIAGQIKQRFREGFTGDNRGEPFVPSIPVELSKLSFSPDELALDKLAGLTIPRICGAMGLDPMVVGLPSASKTYSNYREAREAAYENVIIPLQRALDETLTEQLMPEIRGAQPMDEFGRDYANVRALQEDVTAQYKRLTEAVGGPWMSADEARGQLGMDPIEGGDALYPAGGGAPMGADPAAQDAAAAKAQAFKQAFAEKCRARRRASEREA